MSLKIDKSKTLIEIKRELGTLIKKEQISIKVTATPVKFICAIHDNRIVGVVGYSIMGTGVRYKTDFVHPMFRGNGYYKELWAIRDNECRNLEVTAYCTSQSLPMYLKNNFIKIGGLNKYGIQQVKRLL